MKINSLLAIAFLSTFSLFAQTKNKSDNPQNANDATGKKNYTIKKPAFAGKGVPSAEQSIFAGSLDNFKPLQKKDRPTLKPNLQIMRDADGNIIMIKGSLDNSTNQQRTIVQKANDYLAALQEVLPFRNPSEEFRVVNENTDELGITHIRMQQLVNNVEIYGAEIILHGKNGTIEMMNGRFYPTPVIEAKAAIDATAALRSVEKSLSEKSVDSEGLFKKLPFAKENTSKIIVFHKNNDKKQAHLVWHCSVSPNTLAHYEYFIDAQNGEVVDSYLATCDFVGHHHKQCTHANTETPIVDGPVTATGVIDLFGIGRTLNTHLLAGSYYMMDTKRTMYSTTKSVLPDDPVGAIVTLDAFNTSPEKPTTFSYDNVKSVSNIWSNKTAVSAHYNGGIAYDYFKKTFGRESINGKGSSIISFINISEKNGASMENAYWNGESMFYGNGGSAFSPLARGLDVAGHEMSHGVIQETAALQYQGESGALNESFADIFGAMIDRDDWKVGEDVVKVAAFPSGALRDLSNPSNGGVKLGDNGWQPKNVSEQYKGTQDNGGVHINSGIPNFAFYKLATATTKEKAEKIFYRALSNYLVKSSKFIDLRAAVAQSAIDLHGVNSLETTQVKLAFDAVGIGGGGSSTGTEYQKDVTTNPGTEFLGYTNDFYKTINTVQLPVTASTTIKKVSDKELNSRPSITDDGEIMVYVAVDNRIYASYFDYATGKVEEEVIGSDPVWNNVVISKDGNLLAATNFPKDNIVTVYDFTKNPTGIKEFTLYNPTYTEGVETGEVQYADALEFDITSENIMYDAFNKIKGKTGDIEYWDIGFLNVYNPKAKIFTEGNIEKLFSALPELTSVGNAQFSKNSPHIVVFDYIDEYEKKTYIVSANLQTGKTGELVQNGNEVGYPTFSRKDDKIAFEGKDLVANYIATVELNADKLSTKANSFKIFQDDVRWPIWFANGKRNLSGTQDNIFDKIEVYPNPFDASLTIDATENINNQTISVFDILGKKIATQTLFTGKNTLQLTNISSGTYFLKIGSSTKKIIKL